MEQAIQDFISSKRLAFVGASRDPKKFGNMAFNELRKRGYQVYPVNPLTSEIDGEKCYSSLIPLKEQVDGVVVAVPRDQVPQVLREASEAGLGKIWLQQQAESAEALQVARALGLDLIYGKCILMYAPPVRSYHGFHRFVMRLFGKL